MRARPHGPTILALSFASSPRLPSSMSNGATPWVCSRTCFSSRVRCFTCSRMDSTETTIAMPPIGSGEETTHPYPPTEEP